MDQQTEVSEEIVHQGKWLIFKHLLYKINGKDQIWEMIERPNSKGGVGCYSVIKRQDQKPQILIIANFRIPVHQYVLEFPGGLMEEGNINENGIRELQEETGYQFAKSINLPCMKQKITLDPWKNKGFSYTTLVEIDGDHPQNQNPKQSLDEAELIKVHLLDLDEHLCDSIKDLAEKQNYAISSAVLIFAMGFCASTIIT